MPLRLSISRSTFVIPSKGQIKNNKSGQSLMFESVPWSVHINTVSSTVEFGKPEYVQNQIASILRQSTLI